MSTDVDKRIEQLEEEFKELRGFADEARSSLDQLTSELADRVEEGYEDLQDNAEDVWDDTAAQGRKLLNKTRKGAKKAYYATVDYTQEHPWRVTCSVLALFGVIGIVCYLASERSNNQLDSLKRRYRDLF